MLRPVKTLASLGTLSTTEHDCRLEGATYVYAVLSRRTRGVSVGIDLCPNAACNWRCVYCQVPGLSLGAGPAIDLEKLERELEALLDEARNAGVLEHLAPPDMRRLTSVAISGNGEPTTSPHFGESVGVLGRVLERSHLRGKLDVVLITNGSMTHHPSVLAGIEELASIGGQVWFKLDGVTREALLATNHCHERPEHHLEGLRRVATRCTTWVQTCLFRRGGVDPDPRELDAYLNALSGLLAGGLHLAGVQLYTIARRSMQPEAAELHPLPARALEAFADRIRALGLDVRVAPGH
jgi:wyosine [tRNA(Phe)-imidazoG37] synthetase (radical SAM superfamily)